MTKFSPRSSRNFAGRTYAKLDKEVVFVGMGKRAEIWDKARWDEKNAEVELNIEEIASDMEASGFSI